MTTRRVSVALCAAVVAVAGGIGAASAEESISVVGFSPTQTCAARADGAVTAGTATNEGVRTCTAALGAGGLTPSDRAGIYANRGVIEEALGRHDAALADFKAGLRLDPNSAALHADVGVALWAQHRPGEAVAEFSQALDLAPAHPAVVYFNRALANEDRGEMNAAYLDYLKASRLAPDWDQPKRELARFTVVHREAQG